MAVVLADASYEALFYIAQNLRERDREEINATRWSETPESLAADTFACGNFQWVAYLDDEPVASIGAFPGIPNVWTVWAYGTDKWPKVVKTLTRHVRRFMIPALENTEAVRVHCFAYDGHTDARRWLEALGATPETRLDNWGKNGQRFVLYSWTREGVRSHVQRKWRRANRGPRSGNEHDLGGAGDRAGFRPRSAVQYSGAQHDAAAGRNVQRRATGHCARTCSDHGPSDEPSPGASSSPRVRLQRADAD